VFEIYTLQTAAYCEQVFDTVLAIHSEMRKNNVRSVFWTWLL